MTRNGYVLVPRETIDRYWGAESHEYSKAEAFLDLIMMARYQDEPGEIKFGSTTTVVNKGEIAISISTLERRWRWSNSRVRRTLKLMRDNGDISYESGRKITHITVANYGMYERRVIAAKVTGNCRVTDAKMTQPNSEESTGCETERRVTAAYSPRNCRVIAAKVTTKVLRTKKEEENSVGFATGVAVSDQPPATILPDPNDLFADDTPTPEPKPKAEPKVPEDFEKARLLYRNKLCPQSIPGSGNAWKQFQKRHKDWRESWPKLLPAIEQLIEWRKRYQKLVDDERYPEYTFTASAKNWGTYVGPGRWWEEDLMELAGTKTAETSVYVRDDSEQQGYLETTGLRRHTTAREQLDGGLPVQAVRSTHPDCFDDDGLFIVEQPRYVELNMERWRKEA